jgi:hypothetical protein
VLLGTFRMSHAPQVLPQKPTQFARCVTLPNTRKVNLHRLK